MDDYEDANEAFVGGLELTVPGFTELTKYPAGSRMLHGFLGIEREALPPRYEYDFLHTLFVGPIMQKPQ